MLQGAGAEGVIGGVGQLALAGEQGDLQNAARLDEMKYQRDAMQAQAQQGINASEAERKFYIGMGEKQDAEIRRAQAEANRNAAIEGIFGFAAQGLKSASKLKGLYGKESISSAGGGLKVEDAMTVGGGTKGYLQDLINKRMQQGIIGGCYNRNR